MAEDEDRAARIGALKDRHPRLTWAKIAEQVGVTERAAVKWAKTGALKPENAEALAEVFGVDFDYIWNGPRPDAQDTPDPFASADGDRLARIERRLDEIQGALRLLADAAAIRGAGDLTRDRDWVAGQDRDRRSGHERRATPQHRPAAG